MVAGQFVQQYYHVLKSYSKHLHRFYMEDSSFTISGKEGMDESKTAKGQAIQTILTDHLPEAQADCQSFEAQLVCVPGLAGQDPFFNNTPILIQAAGALLASGKSYSFTQTFFLAPFGGANRGPGYYVANDILRLTPTDSRPALENGFVPVAAPLALDAVADKPSEVVAPPPTRRSATPPPVPAAAPAIPQPEPAAPAAPKAAPAPVQPKTPAPVIEKPAPPSPASVVAAAASAAATAATAPAAAPSSPPPRGPQPTVKPADPLPTTTTTPAPPSPSPAINPNLTWSERVKLSTAAKAAPAAKAATTAATAATAAITPSPAPATKPIPAAAAPTPSLAPTFPTPTSTPLPTPDTSFPTLPTSPTKAPEPSSNGAPAPHDDPPTNTVMVQDLPESTPQQVLDLLAQFGPIKGGVDGISLKPYKDKWTAYLDFETREALDLAVAAELHMGELRVKVVERRSMHGKGSRGRGGAGRFGAGRGERRADSLGRRPPPPGGLANGGAAERPPRSGRGGFHSGEGRPEGVEGERTRAEGGRGEGRGRRGARGTGRGRGRNADGPRAASPGPSAAPAAAGEA